LRKPTRILLALVLTAAVIFTACRVPAMDNADADIQPSPVVESTTAVPSVVNLSYRYPQETKVIVEPTLYSDEEVTAIATTLDGECYDDKLNDKRSVAEVICNRVSDGNFGDSIAAVVSAKGQFAGYWNQSRPISESDIQIAKETLREWYANGCEKLSEYLFFYAGSNRENVFRTTY
jgi:hypothetical protein